MSTINSNALTPVEPTKPAAPYLGGKSKLAGLISKRIAAIPHVTYAEVFVGMGGVFLRRPEKPKAEVINDINRELATFYRVLQEHYTYFMRELEFKLTSRADFDRLCNTRPDTLTDLQRAARFLYLQRNAFGGKPSGRNFGVSADRPGRFDMNKVGPMLEALHERMSAVVIECLPYDDFIRRYDKPGTLFYLDPPYYGNEKDYGDVFSREDFEKMAAQLAGIRGRFIVSLNDRPEVRDIFSAFRIEAVKTSYSVGKTKASRGRVGEVLISN